MATLPRSSNWPKRLKAAAVLASVLVGLTTLLSLPALAQKRYPGKHWEKAGSPEELGWSSEKLRLAREYSEKIGSSAVMIIDDGIIVDEWGDTALPFRCHSIRKAFLSALIGIHVHEGHIKLDSTLEELGIDDNEPSLTPAEKQATVADLLKSRSGVYHAALFESAGMRASRPLRGSHHPGTYHYYNNWDFNALGTIFEQETGTKIFEEFKRRIADPLQMEDFRVEDGYYFRGPDSIHPAYPFRMTARDMARFGLLYLRNGRWRDQQVVSAEWIRESTTSYTDYSRTTGWGYMWNVMVSGPLKGAFYRGGAGSHFVFVFPSQNLVIVHRVDSDFGQYLKSGQGRRLRRLIQTAKHSPGLQKKVADLDKAIELDPKNAEARFQRAVALRWSGQDERAISDLEKTVELDPTYVKAYDLLGQIYRGLGQHDESISYLKKLIELNPTSPEAHYELALSFISQGDSESARHHAEISCDFEYEPGCSRFGWIRNTERNLRREEHGFRAAIAADPTNAEPYLRLCRIFYGAGRYEEAVKWCKEGLKGFPGEERFMMGLATTYQSWGRTSEAAAVFDKMLELYPDDARVLNRVGWMYATSKDLHLKNPGKALECALKAVALTKEANAAYLDTLAVAYYVNDRFDEAIATARKAISLGPADKPYYHAQLKRFLDAKQTSHK